jgi:pimeloyl-ACP methyl ester carboxylesterase
MDGEPNSTTLHRRMIDLDGRGPGQMALLDFGPPDRPVDVVFLHANGFNAMTYRSILAPLEGRLRLLSVDQRGHGASTLNTERAGRTSWYDMRDDLLALMRVLDLRDVVLAGHSMGGTASALAAASEPARVKSLRLFDPVVMAPGVSTSTDLGPLAQSPLVQGALRRRAVFPNRTAALEAYRGRGAFRTWPEETLADYVAGGFVDLPSGEVTLACEPAWEASNFTSHGHDTLAAFRAVRCPIHILRASDNSTCRIDSIEAELRASGRFHMETVPGTTHFLPMERPDLVRASLLEATTPAPA